MFRHFAENLPEPVLTDLRSKATKQDVRTFVAERRHTDLMFLRLPAPGQASLQHTTFAWREEWMLGSDDFWEELERTRAGKLGSRVQSKKQYLGFVEDLLQTAAHIPAWAIAHTENGFISSDDLTDIVSGIRKIDAVFTKDFSDLLGVRASIISAAG
jgi:hypothetical protein